jgi:hypothetical protein
MGFFDGEDQGENAKTRCTVIAARHGKQENTLIMELPIVFNNAQKPCGGCVVRFPHLFWQPRAVPCADLRTIFIQCGGLDFFFILLHTVPIFIQGDLSALRKKKKTAKNRHPQTQEKTAEKPTQE